MSPLSKEEIKKRAVEIEKIYHDYSVQLNAFKKKQRAALNRLVSTLERKKINQLRNSISHGR